MQKDVGEIFVRHDKAITLRRVEPLDVTRHLQHINCDFILALNMALKMWRFFPPHAAFPRFTSNAAERHATKTNRLKDTRCEDSIAVTRGQWNFPKRLSNPQFSDDFVICW